MQTRLLKTGTPNTSLDAAGTNIAKIIAYLNGLADEVSALSAAGSATGETLVNDSGVSLSAGSVVGYSGGAMALALATAAGIRALCVVPATTASGASFTPGIVGAFYVRTDGAGGFTQGGGVWLSAGTSGTATATRPVATGKPQLLGRAATATVETDGTILTLVNLTGLRTTHV